MTPEVRERIFDAFFTTKPAGEGTGLGLDIVRKIVEKHGGRILVDSAVGQGSTFTVSLPIAGIG
jgi:signal transduction histidine kinase